MDLSDVIANQKEEANIPTSMFFPYPNYSAFLLGEWYWGNGVQKTKDGFQKLVNIITGGGFNPADIQNIAWDSVNKLLGGSGDSQGDRWLDKLDAGWKTTTITLSIPFRQKKPDSDKRQRNSGNKTKCTPTKLLPYTFPPFHHRSIVDVLKEKMTNLHDFQHFHLEPFQLQWQYSDKPGVDPIRVYGELYTSPAFLEAHKEIQNTGWGTWLPATIVF